MTGTFGAVTVFVQDLTASRRFYRDVFGRPFVFEDEVSAVIDLGGVLVNLLAVSEAPEVIAPATTAPRGSGAQVMLSVFVPSVDDVVRSLQVPLLNGPVDRPWGVRTAAFADPDGIVWEIAQRLG